MMNERRYKLTIAILLIIAIAEGVFFLISRPRKLPQVLPVEKGKIAIVLDDWGYNLNNLPIIEQIKFPLTASILPNLPYSQEVALELKKIDKEVILHLPLEPREKYNLEKNTINHSMDEATIINILSQDLASIPGCAGASNHMGSRATEDIRTMRIIFKELKRRHLYFLDSFVSAESVCFKLAGKMNFGFAKRDVFLDNKEEPQYIKQQINKLKSRANTYGQAIGIGHDRKITLEVLKEMLPELAEEGYQFVFVSELIYR